jgi:hypothetical protein
VLDDGVPDPPGPVVEGGSSVPLDPVLGVGSLAAPELGPDADPSGALGAGMELSPDSLGLDAMSPPPLSDVEPLEEGPSAVDDDPESVGNIDDSSDEPESDEPPGDGSGSLGDIGASQVSSVGGIAAFAVPVPQQTSPTPRPLTTAMRATRFFIPKVRLPLLPSTPRGYKRALSCSCARAVKPEA